MNIREIGKTLGRMIYPARCRFCGRIIAVGTLFCEDCAKQMQRVEPPICRFCGAGRKSCICEKKRNFFDGLTSPFYYTGPAAVGIRRMKFYGRRRAAVFFGKEMAQALRREKGLPRFDRIAYVPMTKKQVRARGYNQSRLLAHVVSKELGIPVDNAALVKRYETRAQRTLNRTCRRGNVIGVFDAGDVAGCKILLCDDIRTTGATLNECAKMLKLGGANAVWALTAAVSVGKKETEQTETIGI